MPRNDSSRFTYRRQAPAAYSPPPVPAPARKQPKLQGPAKLWATLQIVKDENTGATKTTRAMEVPGGVLVNTCTRGANFAAEALVLVPGVKVMVEPGGLGYLVADAGSQ